MYQTPQLNLLNMNLEANSASKLNASQQLTASATNIIVETVAREDSKKNVSNNTSSMNSKENVRRRSKSAKSLPHHTVFKRKASISRTTNNSSGNSVLSFSEHDGNVSSGSLTFTLPTISTSSHQPASPMKNVHVRRSSAPNTAVHMNQKQNKSLANPGNLTIETSKQSVTGVALVTTNAIISMLSREVLTNLIEENEEDEVYIQEVLSTSDLSSPLPISPRQKDLLNSIQKASKAVAGNENSRNELSRHMGIMRMLQQVSHWNWDVFELNIISNGNSLLTLAHYIFLRSNLYAKFKIDRDVFFAFMKKVQDGYHSDNPYHNSTHATDVLHGVNWLKDRCFSQSMPTELELLALYFAAIVHDLEYDTNKISNNC